MAKYHFTLRFDKHSAAGGHDDRVLDQEISRVLDEIVGKDYLDHDLVWRISQTPFYRHGSGIVDDVLQTMLMMLAVSRQTTVAYCWDCQKYLLTKNPSEILCADDSHRVYRIDIKEVDYESSPLVRFVTRNERWSISRTVDANSITFYLHDTAVVLPDDLAKMSALPGFDGVSVVDGCLCVRADKSKLVTKK